MRSLVVLCAALAVAAGVPQPWPQYKVKRSVQMVPLMPVSHQSRFEFKTSQIVPASVVDEAVANLQARAVAPLVFTPSVSHQDSIVPGTGSAGVVAAPVIPAPLAAPTVYAGQVPTLYAGASAVTHQLRYVIAGDPVY